MGVKGCKWGSLNEEQEILLTNHEFEDFIQVLFSLK